MGEIHEIKSIMTAKEIAKKEGKTLRAIQARWQNAFREIPFDSNAVLSPEQVAAISRNSDKRAAKKNYPSHPPTEAKQPAVIVPPARFQTDADDPAPEWEPEQPGDWMKGQSFLVWILWACMIAQMVHTGGFFYHNSPVEQPFLRVSLSIIFALAVDCTALIMTVHRGGWRYLAAFALLHLAMNITFHSQAHGITFGNALLSFVLALSNFSYTELFSKK